MQGSLIFPIVRTGLLRNLEEICGTGTYVARPHMFITCAHLSEEYPGASYRAALDPENLVNQTAIEWLCMAPEVDLAVGITSDGPLGNVEIGSTPMLGERVSGKGFQGGTFREPDGEYTFVSRSMGSVAGNVTMHIPRLNVQAQGPFRAKSFPALVTDMVLPNGFSGGPILNEGHELVGVHSNMNTDRQLTGVGQAVSVSVTIARVQEILASAVALYDQR